MASQVLGLLVALTMLGGSARADAAPKPGRYDGGQMEMAAVLDLRADGRFEYWLSYGALDESAAGRWRADGENVILVGDPVVAPRFVLLSSKPEKGSVTITLEAPNSLPVSLFTVAVKPARGDLIVERMGEEGVKLPVDPTNAPVSLQIALPMIESVSDPVDLSPGTGRNVRFRFEPNDFGKVDFRDTILVERNGALILVRHGREIRFRLTPD